MTKGQRNNPKKNTKKTTNKPMPPIDNKPNDIISNKETANDTAQKNEGKCNIPQPMQIEINEKKGMSISDKIQIAGIVLNIALFFIAYFSWRETKRSVDGAEASFKVQRESDSVSERERKLMNDPLLEIKMVFLRKPKAGKRALYQYEILNLTPTPLKVIESFNYLGVGIGIPPDSVFKWFRDTANLNQYLIRDKLQINTGYFPIFTQSVIDVLNDKNANLYFCKKIRYLNLANNKIRVYDVRIKLKYIDGETLVKDHTYWEYDVNENKDEEAVKN